MLGAPTTPPGWAGTTCLVTGGLGFIGSNLARALVEAGATVRVLDALVPEHGGRPDQLDDVAVERIVVGRVDCDEVGELVDGVDAVFNLAGQVSHLASMHDPLTDLALNATSHVALLEAVRRAAPRARVVYASTRQVYGRSSGAPVDEGQLPHPVDVNGVAKLAGEQLHLVYSRAYGVPTCALRLTNVYGPRQRLTSDHLGFLPVFIRRALTGQPIEIFGDGQQRRDCVHVADVVDAFLRAAGDDRAVGRTFNIGHAESHALADIANLVLDAAGRYDAATLVPWPADLARIDIGSFHTASAAAHEALGWEAAVGLEKGLVDTVAFYREHPWYLSSA